MLLYFLQSGYESKIVPKIGSECRSDEGANKNRRRILNEVVINVGIFRRMEEVLCWKNGKVFEM